MKLPFQVANVRKPLVSVKRMVEKGNKVQFGPGNSDNYIVNGGTGDGLMLKPTGRGCYVMQVRFAGGEPTEIVVDSGAEEHVCPYEWGQQFGITEPKVWMQFKRASGSNIEHFGSRDVMMESPF